MAYGQVNTPGASAPELDAVRTLAQNAQNGADEAKARARSMEIALNGSETLMGDKDPTTATAGMVGQHYLNTATGKEFVCVAAADGNYTWEPVEAGTSLRESINAAQAAAQAAQETANKVAQDIEEGGGVGGGTGGNTIKITFEAAFKGQQYTVSDGDDTKTGTVPEGLVVSVKAVNCNSIYTIKAKADNGVEYSTTVSTGAYYGQYTASLAVFNATINVTAAPGAEVKATKGSASFTATANSSGVAAVKVNQAGTYTITATKDGAASNSASVNVTAEQAYTATVKFIVLTIKSPAGSALTLNKGSEKFTKTTTGTDVFYLPSTGTWTATITKSGETATGSVNASTYQAYTLELSFIKIYGVCWNYGSTSTGLTRLTKAADPNKLVNTDVSGTPTPAVGTGSGSSPFDSLAPWSGMEEYNIVNNAIGPKQGESGFSRTGQDTVVKIPEFGFKIIDDATNKKRYFYVADKPKSGVCEKHPGSGKYVARYNTISGNFSKSGAAPLVSITRATARSGAKGKGSKWSEYDYASWCAVWLLYLVEYADWDSQAKIGRGYVDGNSGAINSGGTDTMTYHTGRASGTDGKTAVQYRHIENPWGNVWEWIDGINFNERAAYICTDPSKYADDTNSNYTAAGITLSTDGWIKTLGQSSGFPWAFLPTGVGGSETTCIPDCLHSSTGWRVLMVGGDWNDASSAGLLYFCAYCTSSGSYGNVGARLLYNP